jgi:hypothetical protein
MDAKASYHLVPLPPEQRALIPVSSALVLDAPDHPEPDLFALLWRCFCKLVGLLVLALWALRRLRLQLIELRLQANYYRSQQQRAVQREAALKEQVQILQGEIRELKRRLFGRKSETSSATKPTPPANNRKKRSRGQQSGSQGHGRRDHDHLPTTSENCVLPKDQQCCATCGEPFSEIPGTAAGDILEIEIRAHRRRYQRQRYRRH